MVVAQTQLPEIARDFCLAPSAVAGASHEVSVLPLLEALGLERFFLILAKRPAAAALPMRAPRARTRLLLHRLLRRELGAEGRREEVSGRLVGARQFWAAPHVRRGGRRTSVLFRRPMVPLRGPG